MIVTSLTNRAPRRCIWWHQAFAGGGLIHQHARMYHPKTLAYGRVAFGFGNTIGNTAFELGSIYSYLSMIYLSYSTPAAPPIDHPKASSNALDHLCMANW